jgi:hypothetical protein
MGDKMNLSWNEEIKRTYDNGVTIVYEDLGNNSIYIHSIFSLIKRQGNANITLNAFLDEFKTKNIFLFSSSELGTDKQTLDTWYEKFGFIKTENRNSIPYNVTHVKVGYR